MYKSMILQHQQIQILKDILINIVGSSSMAIFMLNILISNLGIKCVSPQGSYIFFASLEYELTSSYLAQASGRCICILKSCSSSGQSYIV